MKKMKESSNADMSGKVKHSPPTGGVGGVNFLHYQQLPIKVKLSRLQVQPLIEKGNQVHEGHIPGKYFSIQPVGAIAAFVYE